MAATAETVGDGSVRASTAAAIVSGALSLIDVVADWLS
jgi:hypothetical protein